MKILFVDNFRGFKNTYIPITEVNFLVGENSTGKTSILSLIKLLHSAEFWINNFDFNSEDIHLGHYRDIVSINATDQKYFSIGLIEEVFTEKAEKQIVAFLLTFTNHKGIPQPMIYAFSIGKNEFRIRLTKKQMKFKHKTIPMYSQVEDFVKEIYCEWITAYKKDTRGYKVLPEEIRVLSNTPPLFIGSALAQLKEKQGAKAQRFRLPFIREEITWLAPIRTKPRRTYDEYNLTFSSEGAHTPYVIKNILERKSAPGKFKKFLDRVGRDSGLFDSIKTKTYGRGVTAPFELDIILQGKALSISNVGYGVSQALPVIVEAFITPSKSWTAIQQPEVHLHPKAQAALGDIFFELAVSEGKRFIVETHSDYTIDRFRLNYKKKDFQKKPQAQILYFERDLDGNNKVYQIEIQNNGELPADQPQGYRDFFIREEMALLGL